MLELMKEWLETAQICQQENYIVSKSAVALSRYSSGSSSNKSEGSSGVHFTRINSKISEEDEDYEDDEDYEEYQPSGEGGARSPPATPHCLQNPKWPPGGPKMAEGVWKGDYL